MTAALVTLALVEGLILGGAFYYLWARRWKRLAAAKLLEELLDQLKTSSIIPRGWPEEEDCPHSEAYRTEEGPCHHCGEHPVLGRPDDYCPECPAVGVWGVHSEGFLESEGKCAWCGADPQDWEDED